MINEQQQERASLYALGSLSGEERRAFEEALGESAELTELVRGLERTANLLALAVAPHQPPATLRPKVLSQIAAAGEANNPPAIAFQESAKRGFKFHAASDSSGWKQLPVRGAWIKLLSMEKARGYAVLLGRLEAGVRYPAHTHFGAEELYILTGDLQIGDLTLGPGDFHHADAGTAHGVNHSIEGCTLLAVLPVEHELVKFALAVEG